MGQAAPFRAKALIIAVFALALRVYHLGTQSLWYDEGFSAFLARLPLAQLLEYRGMDPHPPLHALTLGWWTVLAGDSEVALRFPSVLAGTTAVVLTYRLGTDLLGQRVGLYAGLLAAVNPFLIHYGQEVRPYSLLLVFTLASSVMFLRLLARTPAHRSHCPEVGSIAARSAPPARPELVEGSNVRGSLRQAQGRLGSPRTDYPFRPLLNSRWAAYTIVTALALWSHYFAVFTLAGQWLLWLLAAPRTWPAHRAWLLAQGVVALTLAPWLALSLGVVTGYRAVGGAVPLAEMVRQTLTTFMAGPTIDPRPFLPAAAALSLLTAGGLLAAWLLQPKLGQVWTSTAPPPQTRQEEAERHSLGVSTRNLVTLALLIGIGAPVAGLAFLSLTRPTFHPRYLIAAAPWVLILTAAVPALFAAWLRPLGWALLGLAAFLMAGWTSVAIHDARHARDDYRSAAAFVAEHVQPDDALLYHAWYTGFVFDYYFRSPQARYTAFRNGPLAEDAAVAELNQIAARHPRLWVVLWQDETLDPGRHVLAQLDGHATRTAERWLGPLRIFGYRLPDVARTPFVAEGIQIPMQASLGGLVDFLGYRTSGVTVTPGETMRVVSYWRARQPLAQNYAGFVHLIRLRPAPFVYAQQDHPAGGDYYPSTRWQPGETVRDEYAFQVPGDVAPGEYILEVGLYTPADFTRLVTAGEGASPGHDSIFLTELVTVQAPR